jgi:hypothetical protein
MSGDSHSEIVDFDNTTRSVFSSPRIDECGDQLDDSAMPLTVSGGWWSGERQSASRVYRIDSYDEQLSHRSISSSPAESMELGRQDSMDGFEESWETVYECKECHAVIDALLLQGIVWLGCEMCGSTDQPLIYVRCPACQSLNSGTEDQEKLICEVCGFGEHQEDPESDQADLAGIGALLETTPQDTLIFKLLHPLGSAHRSGQVCFSSRQMPVLQ